MYHHTMNPALPEHPSGFAVQTTSVEDTIRLGRELGPALTGGVVVSVEGDLGSGKTQICKGMIAGATGIDHSRVSSPAFTLINEYQWSGRDPLIHIDFYRLDTLSTDDEMLFDEALTDEISGALIEWGDKFVSTLAPSYLRIHIELSLDEPAICTIHFDAVHPTALETSILNEWRVTCERFS